MNTMSHMCSVVLGDVHNQLNAVTLFSQIRGANASPWIVSTKSFSPQEHHG